MKQHIGSCLVYVRKLLRLIYVHLCWGRIFSLLINFLCAQLRLSRVFFKPTFVMVEPGRACNLSCVYCPTGRESLKRADGFLSWDLFRQFVDQNAASLAYVLLYNQGEPLLNPRCCEMVKYAVAKNIFVKVSTNGFFKDSAVIDQIVDSGLDEILVSLDFADKDLYARFKGRDVFDDVLKNVQDLVKKRGSRKRPFINLQLLMTRESENHRGRMLQVYQRSGADKLLMKKVRVDAVVGDLDILPKDKRYVRAAYDLRAAGKNLVCMKPWLGVVVLWDGGVLPCCADVQARYRLGNIGTQSLKEMWQGQALVDFRKMASGRLGFKGICQGCGMQDFSGNFIKNSIWMRGVLRG